TENINGKGTAVIASRGLQGTYSMGEKIDSTPAIVKQVYFDRVIIQNGDKRETLMLDGVVYDNNNVATAVRSPDSRR
ncbi:MAG: type II secretion system protein GspC, partial [Psychrosphaera sp.]|nr:type II secretion system protein GspC [Psychrosphaera sp.]